MKGAMDEEQLGTMSGSQERLREQETLKSQGEEKSADEVVFNPRAFHSSSYFTSAASFIIVAVYRCITDALAKRK